MKTDKFTTESGKRAKLVVRVSLSAWTDPCMTASGLMISITARELSNGSIIRLSIPETTKTARRLERVNSSSMEMSMKVISLMDNSTGTENITFLSQVKNMKVNLRRT